PALARTAARLKARRQGTPRTLASALLPALQRVLASPARFDRKLAALRCVEAVRLYAAEHDGKLPATLAELTETPIPLDPWTGKPFQSAAAAGKATLTGPPAEGEKPDRGTTLTYELTLRPMKGKK